MRETVCLNLSSIAVACKYTNMSIWNGFASPAVDAEKTVCGQLHYYEQDVIEFKSTHFRVIIRYHQNSVLTDSR